MASFDFVVFAVLLIAAVGATAYGTTRASQEHYARREDADRAKIAQLEAKVQWCELRINELTTELLRRREDPKAEGMA